MSGYLVYLPSYFDRRMARTKKENTTPLGYIRIKGARTNNLKNIDLDIPKNKLIVFTGVSGSGKSSITMDTLYAEGQRRYVESLSSYARQFMTRIKKTGPGLYQGYQSRYCHPSESSHRQCPFHSGYYDRTL